MRRDGSGRRFSPSDLCVFLESEFAAWMDRWLADQEAQPSLFAPHAHTPAPESHACLPDAPGEEAKLLQRRGAEHERAVRDALVAELRQTTDAGRDARRTQEALRAGRALVTHGRLEHESFAGEPDFLVRAAGEAVYEPWDAKLAKSVHPAAVVQLCAYAEMLEANRGARPKQVVVVLGTGERVRIDIERFYHYYLHLKRTFAQFEAEFDRHAPPHPALSASYGRWSGCAEAILAASDHVAGTAGIRRRQIKRLTRAGIRTLRELATSTGRIAGVSDEALELLRAQARLQLASRGAARPRYELRPPDPRDPIRGLAKLPPASALDVALDLEGDPLMEGGLEYLFGATHRDAAGRFVFTDWWGLDRTAEKRALEDFIDWVTGRRRRDPSLHVYHYGAYEVAAMRRLASTHGTREFEVDELLRGEVFVDLYTLVRQGLVIGTPTYSLKDVERLYDPPRSGAVKNAASCMVAYQHWLESGEPPRWQESPLLRDIRAYNQVDCDSTLRLSDWLREVQVAAGITPWQPPGSGPTLATVPAGAHDAAVQLKALLDAAEEDEANVEPDDEHPLAVQLLDGLEGIADLERRRVQELLAHLLGFHRREWKPGWWRFFDRVESSPEEMYDDVECLASLQRTSAPAQPHKRGLMLEFSFDPEQDTKIEPGDTVAYGREKADRAEVVQLDPDRGRVWIVPQRAGSAPGETLHLIRIEDVRARVLQEALVRFATQWMAGSVPWRALDDFLHRRPPRLRGHDGGAIVQPNDDIVQSMLRAVRRLDASTLSVQGPPGTGKTWTAAHVIVALLREGRRVGVMANGHKTILHLMIGVARELRRLEAGTLLDGESNITPLRPENPRLSTRLVKVGPRKGEPPDCAAHGIQYFKDNNQVASALGDGGVLIGATAWAFARSDMEAKLDYLFVDEAGQVSVANVIAAGQSAANLVLLGDQMQLPQPTKGTHPGDSGRSALEYLLAGKATVPADFGVFLDVTRRLHPDVCGFISEAVYEGRLRPHESTARQHLVLPAGHRGRIRRATGVQFVPVPHQHNAQASREEVEVVHHLAHELVGMRWCDHAGAERELDWNDILVVAPYNVQVYKLQRRLGRQARVGSVDRFQGLEAPVVIVSLCASSLEEAPRGVEFLLNRNRLNVAVSRAQSLALVVASPALLAGRVTTLAQMERVNFLCRLADYAAALPTS